MCSQKTASIGRCMRAFGMKQQRRWHSILPCIIHILWCCSRVAFFGSGMPIEWYMSLNTWYMLEANSADVLWGMNEKEFGRIVKKNLKLLAPEANGTAMRMQIHVLVARRRFVMWRLPACNVVYLLCSMAKSCFTFWASGVVNVWQCTCAFECNMNMWFFSWWINSIVSCIVVDCLTLWMTALPFDPSWNTDQGVYWVCEFDNCLHKYNVVCDMCSQSHPVKCDWCEHKCAH